MAKSSQNGWPVVGADQVTREPILGHTFPNGFLKGDVFTCFVWLFTQLHNRVESMDDGLPADEWGWYVKNIEGSGTISNHASGTAGDYNAKLHPMGGAAHAGYTKAQVATIYKILDEADGIFRWGGDYSGRKDPMHFEINKNRAAVHAFAVKITKKEDDMAVVTLDDASIAKLAKAIVTGYLGTDLGHAGGGDTVAVTLQTGYNNGKAIVAALGRIEKLLTVTE